MTKYYKERYKEKFDEGSELLWPSEKEDKVTRKFYRDLSHLSKIQDNSKTKRGLINQLIKLISGKGGSPISN